MSSRFFENPYEDYEESRHGKEIAEFMKTDIVVQLVKDYVERILIETKKSGYKLRSDLYVGDAGIAFMFWKLSLSDELKHLFPCLEYALFYITRAKDASLSESKATTSQSAIAFLCGNAGISAVSAVISNALGKKDKVERDIIDFRKGLIVNNTGSYNADEILVGRAGFLSGAYWLNQVLPSKPVENNAIENICQVLINRGRAYSNSQKLHLPLMYEYHGSEYLGAAHGLCSILQMLLESPWFVQANGKFRNVSKTKFADIKESVEFFLKIQDKDGNFPTRLSSNKKFIHWCHGCSGVIYLLAKAYLIFNEDKFLDGCRKCADSIWRQGLLCKGPGICHGVAGNGYAFLLMYRLTGEKQYLYKACKFMEFLTTGTFLENARIPDRPFSLYEGLAGTVSFLVDLLNPNSAYFPFMDVFAVKFSDN